MNFGRITIETDLNFKQIETICGCAGTPWCNSSNPVLQAVHEAHVKVWQVNVVDVLAKRIFELLAVPRLPEDLDGGFLYNIYICIQYT
jgi:hypothetical protein